MQGLYTGTNLDVEIDIFQIFGNFNMDDKHNIGEYNIIELPDLKNMMA